jgi:flagellar motor protein MotB
MGEDRPVRKRRDDTGKRTIIAAAQRPNPNPPANPKPQSAQRPTPRRGQQASAYQAQAYEEDTGRETVVLPLVTLPTIPSVRVPDSGAGASNGNARYPYNDEFGSYDEALGAGEDQEEDTWEMVGYEQLPPASGGLLQRYRANTEARALKPHERGLTKPGTAKAARQYNKQHHPFSVLFVPGRNLSRRLPPQVRAQVNRAVDQMDIIRRNKTLLVVLAVIVVLTSTLVAISSTTQTLSFLNSTAWQALSGKHDPPTPTPIPAPDITNAGHYVAKYGFDWPASPQPIPSDEYQRMVFMLPFAYRATAAYDRRYHNSIEPEMIVWWTHAEGIGARINYSNCANRGTRAGTNYFTDIENCPVSNFWQLGYGNQFSVIYVLKNAFTDLYGDPNNTALVQKVGQWVLNFDRQQGTVPTCGGYSCTFPAMTIDQIMSGIDETSGVLTADNWWASVLSRDPAINCYMIAHALSFFNHAATLNWVGCYYYEPCWGYESNRLGDVLSAWPSLRKAANM